MNTMGEFVGNDGQKDCQKTRKPGDTSSSIYTDLLNTLTAGCARQLQPMHTSLAVIGEEHEKHSTSKLFPAFCFGHEAFGRSFWDQKTRKPGDTSSSIYTDLVNTLTAG